MLFSEKTYRLRENRDTSVFQKPYFSRKLKRLSFYYHSLQFRFRVFTIKLCPNYCHAQSKNEN